MKIGGRWRNLTESKNKINFEFEQPLIETLKENNREEPKKESVQTKFTKKESNDIEKKRSLKRWKQSEGYFYLHPDKFRFSFKDL